MSVNLDRLKEIARPRSEAAKDRARARKENRAYLRMSQEIALALHYYLRTQDMKQSELARRLDVSPAYVGKLLKGGENLTLETISKLQMILGQDLITISHPYTSCISITIEPSYTPSSTNTVSSSTFIGNRVNDNVSVGVEDFSIAYA